MIVFKTFGDWTGATVSMTALPSLIQSAGTYGQRKAAERLVKIVKGHIDAQDLGWLETSSNTGDPRILVDTELYRNSIKSWKKGDTYYAGVPLNKYYPDGKRVADIAIMHEFGLGKNIERPLWRPSIEEMGGDQGIRRIVAAAIFSKISKLTARGFHVQAPKWL